jgi:hypothetical protein
MDTKDPFAFTFLHIIGSVLIVGLAGIVLVNHLLADIFPLIEF